MNRTLPTTSELEQLSMRALVVYAGRTARRLSKHLDGIVDNDVINESIQSIKEVATSPILGDLSSESVILASHRLANAYASASGHLKSPHKFAVIISVTQAALTAMRVLDASGDPLRCRHHMARAIRAAERAVRASKMMESDAARVAIEAAINDYSELAKEYGGHHEAVIGDAITCFD